MSMTEYGISRDQANHHYPPMLAHHSIHQPWTLDTSFHGFPVCSYSQGNFAFSLTSTGYGRYTSLPTALFTPLSMYIIKKGSQQKINVSITDSITLVAFSSRLSFLSARRRSDVFWGLCLFWKCMRALFNKLPATAKFKGKRCADSTC